MPKEEGDTIGIPSSWWLSKIINNVRMKGLFLNIFLTCFSSSESHMLYNGELNTGAAVSIFSTALVWLGRIDVWDGETGFIA